MMRIAVFVAVVGLALAGVPKHKGKNLLLSLPNYIIFVMKLRIQIEIQVKDSDLDSEQN